jgi:hypothetical protein
MLSLVIRNRFLAWTLLLVAVAVSAAQATDLNTPKTGTAADAPAASAESAQEPRCYNGCLRWGQMCNVDPRGVYKCMRRCEKFGEICE